jgi:elongation factor Ts
MDCKRALEESGGDVEKAVMLLRERGMAAAAKKSGREAREGLVSSYIHTGGRVGVLIEVNCETDFVARETDFRAFAQAVAKAAVANPSSLDALNASKLESGETVDERRRALIAKIGENISVRRFVLLSAPTHLGAYVHGTRIGALVAIEGGEPALAYDLAMHVAASNPRYLSVEAVPAEVVAKERGILTEQAENETKAPGKAKPADIVAKMVEGRLRKSLGEITLHGQAFVKDPDTTVEKLLKTGNAKVVAFERYEVGAGIEKKQEDFAAEVQKTIAATSKDKDGRDQGGGGTPRKH